MFAFRNQATKVLLKTAHAVRNLPAVALRTPSIPCYSRFLPHSLKREIYIKSFQEKETSVSHFTLTAEKKDSKRNIASVLRTHIYRPNSLTLLVEKSRILTKTAKEHTYAPLDMKDTPPQHVLAMVNDKSRKFSVEPGHVSAIITDEKGNARGCVSFRPKRASSIVLVKRHLHGCIPIL